MSGRVGQPPKPREVRTPAASAPVDAAPTTTPPPSKKTVAALFDNPVKKLVNMTGRYKPVTKPPVPVKAELNSDVSKRRARTTGRRGAPRCEDAGGARSGKNPIELDLVDYAHLKDLQPGMLNQLEKLGAQVHKQLEASLARLPKEERAAYDLDTVTSMRVTFGVKTQGGTVSLAD